MGRSLLRVCLWAVVLLVFIEQCHGVTESTGDPCEEKLKECQKSKKTSCKVINGTPTCVCPTSMKENEEGDCFLTKKVTVKFQLKPRKKLSTAYNEAPTCNENITELIQVIMQQVPNVIEESIVCNGNSVSFDVFAETDDEEQKIIEEIFKNCQGDDCNLGAGIRFERKSVDFTATNMCKEEDTQKLAEEMGMICVYHFTTHMVCNLEKTTVIGRADVQGIPFEICKALPCDLTCKDDKMHCVPESCVCKPQYKLENGECKTDPPSSTEAVTTQTSQTWKVTKANKITATLQLKPRKKRSTTDSEAPICEDEKSRKELIREIMQQVPNVIEESIVCNGNSVSFDVFAENADEEEKIKNEIYKNCQGDYCNLGAGFRFDRESATSLEESTWSTTLATSHWRETTSGGTEQSKWQSGHTTEPTTARSVTSGSPSALEESTWSTTLATSHWRETTSGGTEQSKWQSGHMTEPTTARSVTSGSPSGTEECDEQVCKRPRCLCASDAPPAGLRVDEMPQFVMLTFDGAVNVANMAFFRELLDTSRRKNKQNGCDIATTFFVSGEYLDYEAVNQLHSWGNEIAVKSISHRADSSYWQTINSTQWEREVQDQRAMLKAFANVPDSDVTGFRAPFLVSGGDQGFSMLHKHFRYDSTLVHQRFRGERPFYPYTMDFGFRRSCNVWPCPEGSYPGLWVLPINVFFPKHSEGDLPCAMADACLPQPVTANDTFDYLKTNFDEFYATNRAPFPVFLHEAYLQHPERKAGYLRFVDWLLEKDDVYLVTASEVLRFMEDPKPLSAYANHTCSRQSVRGASTCQRPTTCSYKNTPPGGERYMRTCSRCPKNYPWVKNPLGN